MGRSLYFTYDKVKRRQSLPSTEVLEKISKLKSGDIIKMKFNTYLEWDKDCGEFYMPLTRSPSNYGYEVVPFDDLLEYTVLDTNVEPGLEAVQGMRSINFTLRDADPSKFLFNTHRILTDGTVRECEGYGIDYEIDDIEIVA